MQPDYEEVYSTTVNGIIPIRKYQSKRTGLRIVIAEVDGPVVSGFFCLATEAHDDDGLPHTLEHLVFMGSDCYPYKGILDVLANRCLGTGTNGIILFYFIPAKLMTCDIFIPQHGLMWITHVTQ